MTNKAQAKKQKLEEIKSGDAAKAKAIEDSESWNKLIRQAQGVVVKDDIKLLKKTVKRKEADKKKKTLQWTEREKNLESVKDMKQKKRQENIQARIALKKSNAKGRGVSKKRKPGFK